jgi:ABC-type antimicrobial peptide transport system permease subunit
MLFWTILKVAVKSLIANGMRSFLAMLGIIIGVGAVVSMLALGAGAQQQVLQRVQDMGSNLLSIRPAQQRRGGVSGTRQNLTLDDAQAIVTDVPGVKEVAPIVRGSAQLKYFNENAPASVIGSAVTYFSTRNNGVAKGRLFTEGEVTRGARVAVIGPDLAELLFDGNEPVGETVKIQSINFEVVGVLKEKGDGDRDNIDEAAIVPYTVAMKRLFGETRLKDIDVCAEDDADMDAVEAGLLELFRKRHRIADGDEDDIRIFNQEEMIEAASNVGKTFTMLLGGIAGISLLVGGIGIMNIMLVTVTERTREIGIRKAVGARDRDILLQFLLESILISGLGGLCGIGAGFAIAHGIGNLTEFTPIVEANAVILSLSVSASVGVFFGYYPAQRAAKLDTIVALRYE